MKIKVILADDHAVVRHGIKAIIERLGDGIEVVGEASNGKEVLELAKKNPADVYVLDISMPVMNGAETIEQLLKLDPQTKVVVLSMYNDKTLVQQVFKNGARGYILKECATEEIITAIRDVFLGKYYLSSSISAYLVEGFLSKSAPEKKETPTATLTSRQKEILKHVCEGKTEKDIARILNISPYTVHVHKNNIMKVLDIHSTAGLIKYGIKHGIVIL